MTEPGHAKGKYRKVQPEGTAESAEAPYNPLEKINLGISVAHALLARPCLPLQHLPTFAGAGLYAIYYQGDFPAYAQLAEINRDEGPRLPIYVGKASPEGGRKGKAPDDPQLNRSTRALHRRLKEHADSISETALRIEDFLCRYLVVDDIWIPLGESLLIAEFSPLWNRLLDGFGNHDPGAGRYNGLVPKWDVLHPGRAWAARCRPRNETAEQIAAEVCAWLGQTPATMQSRFLAREAARNYRAERSGEDKD
jgi:hypothetical protein